MYAVRWNRTAAPSYYEEDLALGEGGKTVPKTSLNDTAYSGLVFEYIIRKNVLGHLALSPASSSSLPSTLNKLATIHLTADIFASIQPIISRNQKPVVQKPIQPSP